MSEAKCSQVHRLVGRFPSCWEGWNRAMRGAYLKGARAAHDGQPESDCPYHDHRKDCGRLTWSRAFIRSWEDGHRDAIKHIQANADASVSRGTSVNWSALLALTIGEQTWT